MKNTYRNHTKFNQVPCFNLPQKSILLSIVYFSRRRGTVVGLVRLRSSPPSFRSRRRHPKAQILKLNRKVKDLSCAKKPALYLYEIPRNSFNYCYKHIHLFHALEVVNSCDKFENCSKVHGNVPTLGCTMPPSSSFYGSSRLNHHSTAPNAR